MTARVWLCIEMHSGWGESPLLCMKPCWDTLNHRDCVVYVMYLYTLYLHTLVYTTCIHIGIEESPEPFEGGGNETEDC